MSRGVPTWIRPSCRTCSFVACTLTTQKTSKKENVKFERIEGGWRMKVNYEVRRELVGNLDVVGKFDTAQDLTRRGVE